MIRREQPAQLAQALMGILNAIKQQKMQEEAERGFRGAFNQTPQMAPSSTIDVGGMPAQLQRFQGVESQPNYQMLAQLMASSNPMLAQKSANYVGGQKAIESLQPQFGFANTSGGLYATNAKSGMATRVPGSEPQRTTGMTPYQEQSLNLQKDKFEYEKNKPKTETTQAPNTSEITVEKDGKQIKQRVFYDRTGKELNRVDVGEVAQPSDKITMTTRTMMETAPKVKQLVARIMPILEKEAAGLGPVGSRWSEFMTGKVGAPNEDYNRLRVNVGLLTTLLMRMHVGARGGVQIMEKFDNLLGVGKQDPANLRAALEEIMQYADEVESIGKKGGKTGGSFWND